MDRQEQNQSYNAVTPVISRQSNFEEREQQATLTPLQ